MAGKNGTVFTLPHPVDHNLPRLFHRSLSHLGTVLNWVEVAVPPEVIVLVTVEYGLAPPEPAEDEAAALAPVAAPKDVAVPLSAQLSAAVPS